ncbi:phage tail assembly chaperone [Pedomonas sp. V897]|uniref:phage tail assembly chaperone n=1 Tax=Pedomonas sp. V897 TaxID=3446482 RepID=UPI003EE0EE65
MSAQAGHFADICAEAARVATGLLGWPPQVFWQATPQDLWLALEGRLGHGGGGGAAFGRADLARLMARFPDETAQESKGEPHG